MLHAPALPGAPRYGGDWDAVIDHVLADARTWTDGGADALMLENFGDVPFFPGAVPAITVASLTALAVRVRRATDLPLGINLLRNDGAGAVAIAAAVGGRFVRVNVLSGAVVSDQGIIQGQAAQVARDRRAWGGADLSVWADVRVKHAAPLGAGWRPIGEEVQELVLRAGADGVIVSGPGTGHATDLEELQAVREVVDALPPGRRVGVYVGSGAAAASAATLLQHADGLIVGSSVKPDGRTDAPVEARRVRELADAVRAVEAAR
jgi:membrane complex biogenesis BtpA family protein